MKSGGKITDSLLYRYLNNDVTVVERNMVEEWLLLSDDNSKHLKGLELLVKATAIDLPQNDDANAAWLRLKQKARVQHQPKKVYAFRPAYITRIAAGLLLCIGVYAVMQFSKHTNDAVSSNLVAAQVVGSQAKTEDVKQDITITDVAPVKQEVATQQAEVKQEKANNSHHQLAARQKEEICNSTRCPLEICIMQSLSCQGNAKTSFAQCSYLQPDESGALHYKAFNKGSNSCQASVEEITIRRVTTGETIVLNDQSDITAQDFFDYITGEKKGDVIAGIFEADCNNYCNDQSIKLDNSLGMPVLQ